MSKEQLVDNIIIHKNLVDDMLSQVEGLLTRINKENELLDYYEQEFKKIEMKEKHNSCTGCQHYEQ